jgi:hypothetical protein
MVTEASHQRNYLACFQTNLFVTNLKGNKMNDQAQDQVVETAAPESMLPKVQAKFDNKVDVQEVNFSFRKVTDEKTGVEFKRPTITLPIPKPSVEGMIAIFEAGGKGLELLQEAVADVVISRARELLNENEDMTAESFPYEELLWDKISNLPKAERRGGGIPKETWEEFIKDYVAAMPALTGKSVEKVENAARNFANKFAAVKTNKKVIDLLVDQLAIYATGATNAEQYVECINFLNEKADKLLNMSEEELLANL